MEKNIELQCIECKLIMKKTSTVETDIEINYVYYCNECKNEVLVTIKK